MYSCCQQNIGKNKIKYKESKKILQKYLSVSANCIDHCECVQFVENVEQPNGNNLNPLNCVYVYTKFKTRFADDQTK